MEVGCVYILTIRIDVPFVITDVLMFSKTSCRCLAVATECIFACGCGVRQSQMPTFLSLDGNPTKRTRLQGCLHRDNHPCREIPVAFKIISYPRSGQVRKGIFKFAKARPLRAAVSGLRHVPRRPDQHGGFCRRAVPVAGYAA